MPGRPPKQGEAPPAEFRWYATGLTASEEPLTLTAATGGRAGVSAGADGGLALLVCLARARRGLAEPYGVTVDLPEGVRLDRNQYGYAMNLLETRARWASRSTRWSCVAATSVSERSPAVRPGPWAPPVRTTATGGRGRRGRRMTGHSGDGADAGGARPGCSGGRLWEAEHPGCHGFRDLVPADLQTPAVDRRGGPGRGGRGQRLQRPVPDAGGGPRHHRQPLRLGQHGAGLARGGRRGGPERVRRAPAHHGRPPRMGPFDPW